MKKVIFIHGYTSSPRKKKYQLIAQELDKLGAEYTMPQLPGDKHPHANQWLEIIDNEVKSSKLPIVLVGHSLGTRAVLLYLDKFNQKVDTVILIAAFNNKVEENLKDTGKAFPDFWEYPVNIEKIKKQVNKFVVVHSRDDNSIDYEQGVEISQELGAQLITYKDMGHFSGADRAPLNAREWLKVIKENL